MPSAVDDRFARERAARLERVCGYYAVLDTDDVRVAEILVRHASVLQVRLKDASTRELVACVKMAREVTRRAGCLLIVNDRVDVALIAEADGVHLGQHDLPTTAARKLAPHLLIGWSTHSLAEVNAAIDCDYLGFGPVFATQTKANPDPVVGIDGLRAAVVATRLPVVAIGGIDATTVRSVRDAGARAACVIGAVNRAADVDAAAGRVVAAWSYFASGSPSQ